MVLMPRPLARAIEHGRHCDPSASVVVLSPGGKALTAEKAQELAGRDRGLILVCGRYEGIDQRILDHWCDEQISIGDYVLTGGEPAALVLIDAMARMLPGVVGDPESVRRDTFNSGLAPPQYTRPRDFEGHRVPDALLSGDHARIAAWRAKAARERTDKHRPDLLPGMAAGRLWLVVRLPAPKTRPQPQRIVETWSSLLRVAQAFAIAGAVIVCSDTALREGLRATIRQCAPSPASSKARQPFAVKPTLPEALRHIRKATDAKPLLVDALAQKGPTDDPELVRRRVATSHEPVALIFDPTIRPGASTPDFSLRLPPLAVPSLGFPEPDAAYVALLLDRLL